MKEVPETSTDIKFKSRVIQSHKAKESVPPPHPTEPMEVPDLIASNSCNDLFNADYVPEAFETLQNRTRLRSLAEVCDRYSTEYNSFNTACVKV